MKSSPYISSQWPAKLYRKIDIYVDGNYVASSNAYKTLRDAACGYAWQQGFNKQTTGKVSKGLVWQR